jgi:hypothetical protein
MLPSGTTICHLRIRSSDQHAERAGATAIARQVEGCDFRASGIAPSAILLIRSLGGRSRRIAMRSGALLAGTRWEADVRADIDRIALSAQRPSAGRIADDAAAVLFADEAELLACVALDLASPGAALPWWRRALARYLSSQSIFAALRDRLELVPAVFTVGARWNVIEEIVAAIPAGEARQLCRELVAHNALHSLERALLAWMQSEDSRPDLAPDESGGSAAATTMRSSLADRSTAQALPAGDPKRSTGVPPQNPFRDWFMPQGRRPDASRLLLIGIALGIKRAPAALSSEKFARAVGRWLRSSTTGLASIEASRQRETRKPPSERMSPDGELPIAARRDAKRSGSDSATPDVAAPSIAPEPIEGQAAGEPGDGTRPAGWDTQEPSAWPLDGIVTELGGVLCLINVMEHLGLPECFEDSWRLASAVGALGTLEVLARALAGAMPPHLRGDPIWPMLAKLDGREPGAPPRCDGLGARLPGLPAAWRAMLVDDKSIAAASPAPAPADEDAIAVLRCDGWPQPLIEWVALVTPFLEWRINRALATESFAQARSCLLEVPARVYVSETHIDLVMSIDNVRMPLRMAGLDRSPGWVRSMQRVVLFHFE